MAEVGGLGRGGGLESPHIIVGGPHFSSDFSSDFEEVPHKNLLGYRFCTVLNFVVV